MEAHLSPSTARIHERKKRTSDSGTFKLDRNALHKVSEIQTTYKAGASGDKNTRLSNLSNKQ
jgi:hypothetical protein